MNIMTAQGPRQNPRPRISIDPAVCHGAPVITGTRVPVSVILGAIAAGDPPQQVATDYGVTMEDVLAAVAYANEVLSSERHIPLRAKAS